MRQIITGLVVQVTVTQYNDDNQVMGHVLSPDGKPPLFSVAEADIPAAVLEWARLKIGMKGE
jgi:predicted small integral membrane protein